MLGLKFNKRYKGDGLLFGRLKHLQYFLLCFCHAYMIFDLNKAMEVYIAFEVYSVGVRPKAVSQY